LSAFGPPCTCGINIGLGLVVVGRNDDLLISEALANFECYEAANVTVSTPAFTKCLEQAVNFVNQAQRPDNNSICM